MENDKNKIEYVNELHDDHEFLMIHNGNQVEPILFKDFKKTILSSMSSASGQKGEKGNTGEYGEVGIPGDRGEKGIPGLRGEPGQKGRNGTNGNIGEFGSNGLKGDKGQKGNSGLKGADGNTGFQGKTGNTGNKGEKGSRGEVGLRGFSGQSPALEPDPGQKGEPGEDETYAKRGDRGNPGDRGEHGQKGRTGSRGKSGKKIGQLPHAVYGASLIRNWTDLSISSGTYVHLSHFKKDDTSVSYKYFKLILELPDNDNLLPLTSEMVMNIMIPGEVTNYRPVIIGQPPVIWVKDEFDLAYTRNERITNRTPRVVYLDYHEDDSNLGVYIPTKNTNYINDAKIFLKIKKMFGTNDI
jgi:hypothetical protein